MVEKYIIHPEPEPQHPEGLEEKVNTAGTAGTVDPSAAGMYNAAGFPRTPGKPAWQWSAVRGKPICL